MLVCLSTTTRIMTSSYGRLTLYKELNKFKDLDLIKRGDILFFHTQSKEDSIPKFDNKYPGHCGIYLGEHKFIHASSRKKEVVLMNLDKHPHYTDTLVGSKDVISNIKLLRKDFK